MARNDVPIIIKRVKKKVAGGHHGGAWKVAYADFVTAMMAFFLLLWLLNVTTDIQRKGIADYFAPASVSKTTSGAGGMFGGLTITAPGAQITSLAPPSTLNQMPRPPEGIEGEEDPEGTGTAERTPARAEQEQQPSANTSTGQQQQAAQTPNPADAAAQRAAAEAEEKRFAAAEQALKEALGQVAALKDLQNNILIDRTPEGLRIQIVDRDSYSMFPSGSADLYPRSRELIRLIGTIVARLPNKLAISGHTDSKPFAPGSNRDNWDLSSERANASRRVLKEAGLDDDRFANVLGRADRDPLVAGDPANPQNRRISIVLLRSAGLPPELATLSGGNAPSVSGPQAAPAGALQPSIRD